MGKAVHLLIDPHKLIGTEYLLQDTSAGLENIV